MRNYQIVQIAVFRIAYFTKLCSLCVIGLGPAIQ